MVSVQTLKAIDTVYLVDIEMKASQNKNVLMKDAELNYIIQRMSERENDEREEREKKYVTADEKEDAAYERGFSEGFEAGRQKGFAEGWDAAMKEVKKEEQSG